MTYHYYCTCCGRKQEAEDICFDLRDILGFEGVDIFIPFTPNDLEELAEDVLNDVELKHEKREKLTISLFHVLQYIKNGQKYAPEGKITNITKSEFDEGNFGFDLDPYAKYTASEMKQLSSQIAGKIAGKFLNFDELNDTLAGVEADEPESRILDYTMEFYLEPYYLNGRKEEGLETIRFALEDSPHLKQIYFESQPIRGYCKDCHEPVIRYAGQYKHLLVGFLGGQATGKTTLFVAMINKLREYEVFSKFNIENPRIMVDGQYLNLYAALQLNKKGWAVKKTAAATATGSFNATILFESQQKGREKLLLTFVDIAGELCWDEVHHALLPDAFARFPLIGFCDAYVFCNSVISSKKTNKSENEQQEKPLTAQEMNAVLEQIYGMRSGRSTPPPVCLLLTKIDVANDEITGKTKSKNPYRDLANELVLSRKPQVEGEYYNWGTQLDGLEQIYDASSDLSILDVLRSCSDCFNTNRTLTYESIIYCAALGRSGQVYPSELADMEDVNKIEQNCDENGQPIQFEPRHLEAVWDWIFRTLGLIPTVADYTFPYVPAYGESYGKLNETYRVATRYAREDMEKRIEGVYSMYLNPSDHDKKLRDLYLTKEAEVRAVTGWFSEKKKAKIREKYVKDCSDEIERYLESNK